MSALEATDIGLKPVETATGEEAPKEDPQVKYWLGQIDMALAREKSFRKKARRIITLYEGDAGKEYDFNVLYANTETLAPSLFNSTPRPIVKRRYLEKDPLGRLSSIVGERLLSYLLDDGGRETPDFGSTFNDVVSSALVPGRGIPWVKYDAVFEAVPPGQAAEAEASEAREEQDPATDPASPSPDEVVSDEYVCVESVEWDGFVHGYAKTWKAVPWIAVVGYMTKAQVITLAGKQIADRVKFIDRKAETLTPEEEGATAGIKHDGDDGTQGIKTAEVWQIWDKARRRVFYVCREHLEGFLKNLEDPLKLDGFYPCPEPLRFFHRINSLVPQPLYVFYEEQAKELNAITVRINKIVRALKVRGFYDNALGDDLKRMLEADDNVLIPVEGAKLSMTTTGSASIDKGIWLMPIEKLITVLQQLYTARQQCKQVIYEVMGLADVLRGSSVASETATAQQIKAEWGGLRLKRSQKAVMTCVRDTLRIMLEVAVSQFDPARIRAMTGMPLPTAEEKAQQQRQLQELQVAPPQIDPQSGQPIPPQIPPDLQAAVALPTIEEVVDLLKNDLQRKYRIDIETNSTIDAEATEDKKDIAEMMNAMAQFLAGVQPMVENGTLPFEAAQAMLLAVTRRYRFGSEVEDKLMQMKPPQQGADPEEVKKQLAEVAKKSEETEQAAAKLAHDQRVAEMELDFERRTLEMEKKFAIREIQFEKTAAEQDLQQRTEAAAQAIQGKEQLFQVKSQIASGRLAEQKREVDSKGKEVAQHRQTQTAANGELVAAMKDMMTSLADAIIRDVNKAVNTPKRAVKGRDGSWSTEVIETPPTRQ